MGGLLEVELAEPVEAELVEVLGFAAASVHALPIPTRRIPNCGLPQDPRRRGACGTTANAAPESRDNGPMALLIILASFGLATAAIGRSKGSSFFIWFFVGFFTGPLGTIAVVLYRREKSEPERRCPRCGAVHKIYVQVCSRCGEDMYLPDVSEVRPGPDFR